MHLEAAYLGAVRWSYRDHAHRRWLPRVLVSNLLALRSVAVEFGPAELIDSVAVRPVAFYLGPLIFDNTIAGWIFGKLVSAPALKAGVTSGGILEGRFEKDQIARIAPGIQELRSPLTLVSTR